MPPVFHLVCVLLAVLAVYAWQNRDNHWGVPALAVLLTTTVWYVGDVIYNDYEGYVAKIGHSALDSAWLQVLWFLICFGVLVGPLHRWVNRKYLHRRSVLMRVARHGVYGAGAFQRQIDRSIKWLVPAWLVLMLIGLVRTEFDFAGMFAPWLGRLAAPWIRGRIGGGFDALLSLAGYFQLFFTASFGVIAAVARNPKTRAVAIAICLVAVPYYLFGRARNTMLSTLLPGFLSWVFLRLRVGMLARVAIVAAGFLVLESWMKFVIANRSDMSIATAVARKGFVLEDEETRHLGLNMFEELALMNSFFEWGTLQPNWGRRYFAEIANPIPRALWKNKPEIGLDYARARGMSWDKAQGTQGGVAATISTGMIGQGVVNFGAVLGPLASAILMALWVVLLARQDPRGDEPGRLLLYMIGLILTFNMGRDITLLVLYPFLLGLLFLNAWQRLFEGGTQTKARTPRPSRDGLGGRAKPTTLAVTGGNADD
jgi:hypothetical protein